MSIVIPVYNVERYLSLCLKSVREQTLRDIEIVCVDDGSTDGSAALLQQFASVEPRLKVVTQQNAGPSAARNAGLTQASGEVVLFLDSDDFLERNACQRIMDVFAAHDVDVVTFGAHPYPRYQQDAWQMDVLSPRDVVYPEFHPDLILKEKSYPFMWRTAVARTLLVEHGLGFCEDMRMGEDTMLQLAVYPRAKGVALISDRLVNYRLTREDSLMETTVHDADKLAGEHVAVVERVMEDWASIGLTESWPVECFDWTMSFATRFVLLADKDRNRCMDVLSACWRRYFDEDFLVQRAGHDYSVKAIAFDHALAKKRSTLWSYDANHSGKSRVDVAKEDLRENGLRGKKAAKPAGKAPRTARETQMYYQYETWANRDETDCLFARKLLEVEIAAKKLSEGEGR